MPHPPASQSPSHDPYRPGSQRAWQRRPSPLARYALLAYWLVVVDASLFPFRGWRDLGLAPYDYLFAAWPAHALPFDLFVNALGYFPLGFMAGLALHPRLRGAATMIAATLLCAVVSIHLEALQTYLPTRVASKVDVLANVAGGLIGAILAARFAHALLDTGRLRAWRTRWFASDASRGLVLVAAWFAALVYPDAFVLGTGALMKAFDPSTSDAIAAALGFIDQSDPVATANRFQLAETAVFASTMLGAGLLLLNLTRDELAWTKRVVLLAVFGFGTVATAAFAHAFVYAEFAGWPLLTPGARAGLVAAALGLFFATVLPARLRWLLALAALLVAVGIVNIYPDNPYGNPVGLAWTRGKLMNFYGLASGLNLVWPYLAIVYLLRHRGRAVRPGRKRSSSAAAKAGQKPGPTGRSL